MILRRKAGKLVVAVSPSTTLAVGIGYHPAIPQVKVGAGDGDTYVGSGNSRPLEKVGAGDGNTYVLPEQVYVKDQKTGGMVAIGSVHLLRK